MAVIPIYDEPRQTIRLAPGEAAEEGVDGKPFPERKCEFQAAEEEILVEVLFSPRKTACHNLRFWVINRTSKRFVFEILQGNDLAWLRIPEGFLDFRGVNPIVAVKDAGAGFYDETGHEVANWGEIYLESWLADA